VRSHVEGRRPENLGAEGAEGGGVREGGVPLRAGEGPENFEFFDLQMVYFGGFCGAKFNILVTRKGYKNDTLNAWGRERM